MNEKEKLKLITEIPQDNPYSSFTGILSLTDFFESEGIKVLKIEEGD